MFRIDNENIDYIFGYRSSNIYKDRNEPKKHRVLKELYFSPSKLTNKARYLLKGLWW